MGDVIGDCSVCGDPVLAADEDTGKFDPTRPMHLDEVDEFGDVCHLGCSDELFEETHASVDGFDEVTQGYDPW